MENSEGNPIPQAGKKLLQRLESCRPIGFLGTTSKLFEKIIITHLLTHANNSNIIIHQQFDFRKNHSCIQQLQRVMEHITRDKQKQSNTNYRLRFRKTFRFSLAQRIFSEE